MKNIDIGDIMRNVKSDINEKKNDGSITVKDLHDMWISLERYVFAVDARLEKLSRQHPDIAKKYGLFKGGSE